MSELMSHNVADAFELLLCTDDVELSFGGIAAAQFDVAKAATKNGFIFEGVTGPDADEVCEIAGDIAA